MLAGTLRTAEGLLRRTKETLPQNVSRVLLLEYRLPLGCLVHMTPVFEAMKRARPEIEISVATRGLGLQVLRHSRFVDHLIETPDPTTDLLSAVRRLRGELRRRELRPQCVLTGASDQRTRIALLGLLGASGWRGGFTLAPKLYHRPLAYDSGLSLIGNNLRLVDLLGCKSDAPQARVFFSVSDAAKAKALLDQSNPERRPVLAMVTQTSGGQSTGWHTERFVEVIRHAALQRGFSLAYVGTAADAAAIDAIREAADGLGTSLAGKTSVSELAAVLALSDFVVTLDTGTMHVGRSVGVPMVVLGPSWQKPLEWMPLGVENVRILRGEDRVGVPEGYRLDEISAESVIATLDELMAIYPASAESRAKRLQAGLSDVELLAL
ncbi:MAG: glycosyltransferase family 9 protein [Acidobacteriaceae bacterium]|nr:glycosyltransferase family 9 protein [Acidobacteriaceae bacterium]